MASGRPVRAYGEMVGLLWDRGHVAAALELESLWNELGEAVPFSLFCGYRLSEGADPSALDTVCHLHTAVLPSVPPATYGPAWEETRGFETDGIVAVRHFVVDTLRRYDGEDLVEDAALVVTELAANAMCHAGGRFTVSVAGLGDLVRVTVADTSTAQPVRREVEQWATGGRGVAIVAAMATRWGVDAHDAGKAVWADLAPRLG